MDKELKVIIETLECKIAGLEARLSDLESENDALKEQLEHILVVPQKPKSSVFVREGGKIKLVGNKDE